MPAQLPVFLINLDRDTERLRLMSGQLQAMGVQFERLPAVHGTAMPDWLKPYFLDAKDEIASLLSFGEVGCYASHLILLKRIADEGQAAVILEDDLRLAENFPAALNCAADLPEDLDMLKLTCPEADSRKKFPVKTLRSNNQIVKYGRVPWGTGAYLATPAGARKFLKWKTLRTAPIDQDLRRPWDCGMNIYGLEPAPAVQNVTLSTIASMGAPPRKRDASGKYPAERKDHDNHPLVEKAARHIHYIQWLGFQNWAKKLLAIR